MKKYIYPIIVICSFVLFNNCNKSEKPLIEPDIEPIVDPYFTNLNDTTVFSHWACYESYYYLDIDKDSIYDLKITTSSNYSSGWGGYSTSYVKVDPLNGYEIAFSDCITNRWYWNGDIQANVYVIDTVMVPKVFYMGDTIFSEGDYTQVAIKIIYNYSPNDTQYSSGLHYSIEADTNYYMAFRKIDGYIAKLAWLKVKSYGGASITLNSCRYIENEPFLIIE